MNPGDLKLLELLTVDDAAGTLHFAHRRMLLFDADAMGMHERVDTDIKCVRAALECLEGGRDVFASPDF